MRKELKQLLADYRGREKSYTAAARRERRWGTLFDANRYEGIATASRWVAEDLEKMLKAPQRKKVTRRK